MREYKYCALVSFDIVGAFDVIDWFILASIIQDLPIPDYLKDLLKNYISHRLIGFKFARGTRWFHVFRGCPQGSCLGPLLWTLVADRILKLYKRLSKNIVSYADDSAVVEGGDTRAALENKVNSRINYFKNACDIVGLKISAEKSSAMLFGKNTLSKRRPIFKLSNISISVKDNVSYLGFCLDSCFRWLDHLDIVRDKVRVFSCSMRKARIRDSGLPLDFMKTWYHTVVKKQISYGFEVWFRDLRYHGIRRLSSCQRLCLLSIIRVYRSVSTEALCVLSGIPPLELELDQLCTFYNILHDDDCTWIDGTFISRDKISTRLRTYEYPFFASQHCVRLANPITKKVPNFNHPVIYTDGSKMDDGVGCAFVAYHKGVTLCEKRFKLNNYNTVYQAELSALDVAIEWCSRSSFTDFHIYSDSMSSVQALMNLFPTDKLLYNIYSNIRLLNNKCIYIGWIKSHVGLVGNERADFLAKSVILDNIYDGILDIPIPVSYVKRYFKRNIDIIWRNDWEMSLKGRDTFLVLREPDSTFLCYSRVVAYFISSHGAFPSYLYKIGKRSTDKCDCGSVGDVKHYIFGKCSLMPFCFYFVRNRTLTWNMKNVLLSKSNYSKLCVLYNELNKLYSFIKYRF